MTVCRNCGQIHEPDHCIACGKICNDCGELNHFATMCCSTKKLRSKKTPSVKAVNKDTDSDYDTEVYIINEVTGFRLDDLQSMTLKFESGNYLHFQPDTGAQCNVIPVHLYKKATKDHDLKCVTSKEVFQ